MFLKFWLHWICFEFQSCFTRKSWVIVELLLLVLGLWNFESIRKHREIKQATRGTGAGAFSSKFKGPISATFFSFFIHVWFFLLISTLLLFVLWYLSNQTCDEMILNCAAMFILVFIKREERKSLWCYETVRVTTEKCFLNFLCMVW